MCHTSGSSCRGYHWHGLCSRLMRFRPRGIHVVECDAKYSGQYGASLCVCVCVCACACLPFIPPPRQEESPNIPWNSASQERAPQPSWRCVFSHFLNPKQGFISRWRTKQVEGRFVTYKPKPPHVPYSKLMRFSSAILKVQLKVMECKITLAALTVKWRVSSSQFGGINCRPVDNTSSLEEKWNRNFTAEMVTLCCELLFGAYFVLPPGSHSMTYTRR